ncbi:MAG: NAD(+)/NADH kinase [Acutalibacteraceae bacterium]
MKFYIIPNMTRENASSVTNSLLQELQKHNCEVFADSSLSSEFSDFSFLNFVDEDDIISDVDVVVSVGGDGSFINSAKKATKHNKPVLCVNAGKLAYLACLEVDELHLIKNILSGDYIIEKRMILEASIIDKNGALLYHSNCINDAVVSRSGSIRTMKLSISCNDAPLINYLGDGVIVSTPTGSTAYSLSAGGPIVDPCIETIIITPVCPHSMFSRSILLDGESELEIVHDNSGETILSCDGQPAVYIPEGASVRVKKSDGYASFIKIKSDTFIDILNKKF